MRGSFLLCPLQPAHSVSDRAKCQNTKSSYRRRGAFGPAALAITAAVALTVAAAVAVPIGVAIGMTPVTSWFRQGGTCHDERNEQRQHKASIGRPASCSSSCKTVVMVHKGTLHAMLVRRCAPGRLLPNSGPRSVSYRSALASKTRGTRNYSPEVGDETAALEVLSARYSANSPLTCFVFASRNRAAASS